MSSYVEPVHFNDLAVKDPGTVVQNTTAQYDSSTKSFILPVWGQTFEINPGVQTIIATDPHGFEPEGYVELFILHYLINAQSTPLSQEWVSEKDIPGGAAFFRGPHTLPTIDIAQKFGEDVDGFKKTCTHFGGSHLSMADAAFVFDITPSIPVAVLLWLGDEDFGAESKLLFDKTIAGHLPLDIIYALAVMVCKTVCKHIGPA